jgi:Uma2 family endonuclease
MRVADDITMVRSTGMTAVPRHQHSFRDYLEVEEVSTIKHEFLAGEIYAMAGGTPEHAALSAALIVLVGAHLRGGPCRIYTSDLRVRVMPTGLATYPDAAVICGPLFRDPESPSHVTNPTIVFEVLSPGTEAYDLGEKREHYQQIESLQMYIVVAQDRPAIETWRRDGATWTHSALTAGQRVTIDAIGLDLSVDELYREANRG